jgi:hypothetical protein
LLTWLVQVSRPEESDIVFRVPNGGVLTEAATSGEPYGGEKLAVVCED